MGAHYTTPQVKYGVLKYRTKNGRKTESHEITVGSPAWFDWLADNPHFWDFSIGQTTQKSNRAQ